MKKKILIAGLFAAYLTMTGAFANEPIADDVDASSLSSASNARFADINEDNLNLFGPPGAPGPQGSGPFPGGPHGPGPFPGPRGPRPYPYPYPAPIGARFVCYSQNTYGERFNEIGSNSIETQNRAVFSCNDYSHRNYGFSAGRCVELGCNAYPFFQPN